MNNSDDAWLWWKLIPISFSCVWQSNLAMAGMSVPVARLIPLNNSIKMNMLSVENKSRDSILRCLMDLFQTQPSGDKKKNDVFYEAK